MTRLAGQLAAQGRSWPQAYPVLRRVADLTAETTRWPDGNLKGKFDRGVRKGYGRKPGLAPGAMRLALGRLGALDRRAVLRGLR
jgi:hypothetical protein